MCAGLKDHLTINNCNKLYTFYYNIGRLYIAVKLFRRVIIYLFIYGCRYSNNINLL